MEEDDILTINWHNHVNLIRKQLCMLYDDGLFCDVILSCEGETFKCHRVVLSICSDFFKQVLTEHQSRDICIILADIKAMHLQSIIQFMYLGTLQLLDSELLGFQETAECLQIKGLMMAGEEPRFYDSQEETQSAAINISDVIPPCTLDQSSTTVPLTVNPSASLPVASANQRKYNSSNIRNEKKRVCPSIHTDQRMKQARIEKLYPSLKKIKLDIEDHDELDGPQEPGKGSADVPSWLRPSSSSYPNPNLPVSLVNFDDSKIGLSNSCNNFTNCQMKLTTPPTYISSFEIKQETPPAYAPGRASRPKRILFNCDFCGKEFVKKSEIIKHLAQCAHRSRQTEPPQIKSEVQETAPIRRIFKKEPTVLDLEAPSNNHSFKCEHCPFETTDTEKMKQHSELVCPSFRCELCPYKVNDVSIFKCHLFTHGMGFEMITAKCRIDPKKSALPSRIPIKKPPKIKRECNLPCNVCGKLVSSKNSLVSHMRKHTGEKPYKCKLCDYVAAMACLVGKHVRKMHPIESVETILVKGTA